MSFMDIEPNVLKVASEMFNPFEPKGGTENVGPLLYRIARMSRPQTLLESGSGFTTLLLLAACKQNWLDVLEESQLLRKKTLASMDPRYRSKDRHSTSAAAPAGDKWYESGGKACGVDPGFYLRPYKPHLYCFEKLPDTHEYPRRLLQAIEELHLSDFFTYFPGKAFSTDSLPSESLPIDLAWNDDDQYVAFFKAIWPVLSPKGGMLVFHNTVAEESNWRAIDSIRSALDSTKDAEILTLSEPHKLNQSSCTIIRRTSDIVPAFMTRTRDRILTDLVRFMEEAPID